MKELLDHLLGFQSRLLLAIHGLSDDDLRRSEDEHRWSILEVIAHLGDLELVVAVRLRTVAAVDHSPALPALAQEQWVERVHRGATRAELLEEFWFLRRMNVRLLERLREDEWSRTGVHPDYGVNSIEQLATRLHAHEEKHLRQIEKIKSALGLTATATPDLQNVVRVTSAPVSHVISDGIRVRELWQEGARRALQVELDAGAQWPGLDHHVPGPEDVVVLAGDYDDGVAVHGPGAFLHHPAGSSHSPKSVGGCTLFVYYPEG
ncbi:MAG TPA: DinB family protein [Thermoanaerobaculia bacterium]|jgi:hypothetical protein